MSLPDPFEIKLVTQPPVTTITVPGSKSITNRALVLLALSSRSVPGELRGALRSEDTEVMVACLRSLGFGVDCRWEEQLVTITADAAHRIIPAVEADLYVGNSGTTMRFLTAMVSLGHGRYRLWGVPRMHERPVEDLLTALQQLGVNAVSEFGNGCPPVIVEASGLRGGWVRIKGDVSSQFLSGLLMAAPLADGEVTIEVAGPLVSQPYVGMTLAMVRQFGARIEHDTVGRFHIPGQQSYGLQRYEVEPDASAASYFFAAAAITGGQVTVRGLTSRSLQGDVRFVELLNEMGCRVVGGPTGITVQGNALHGIVADMNDISDTVMTLAAVACFAEGPTTIRNVGHIRHKETDRLAALATELRRLGAGVEELADGLTIRPAPLRGAVVETYNDHRMAMSLALIGLRVPGVRLQNPGCVAKTYPGFFEDLLKLYPSEGV